MMTTDERNKVWFDALEWASANRLATLFEESDKAVLILALFRKALALSGQQADPVLRAKFDGYSEGMRQALNIMQCRCSALDALKGVTNPSVTITLTEEEVRDLSTEGH